MAGILHTAIVGSIGWIGAGRVRQARLGSQGAAELLALLAASGAVTAPAEWQVSHLATARASDLARELAEAAYRGGALSWEVEPLSGFLRDCERNVTAVTWADPAEVTALLAQLRGAETPAVASLKPKASALSGVEELFASEEWDALFNE